MLVVVLTTYPLAFSALATAVGELVRLLALAARPT